MNLERFALLTPLVFSVLYSLLNIVHVFTENSQGHASSFCKEKKEEGMFKHITPDSLFLSSFFFPEKGTWDD